MDAKKEINDRLPCLVTSLFEGLGINLPTENNNDTVALPSTLIQNMIQNMLQNTEALKGYMNKHWTTRYIALKS